MTVRRALIVLALALLALPLAACGDKESVVTRGETEGVYVNVGALTYQVQISRQLNPSDPEDRGYLVDVPPVDATLAPDEAWFAVFVAAWNEGDKAAPAASSFEIVDTQGAKYTPLSIGPANVFAYRPALLAGGQRLPVPDSAAANNPSVQGGLLLFKVKITSFANRPLELAIRGPQGSQPPAASVNLDV
jgi:hypothetical protein